MENILDKLTEEQKELLSKLKACSICKEVCYVDNFHKNGIYADGLDPRCKDCCKEQNKKNYLKKQSQYRTYGDRWSFNLKMEIIYNYGRKCNCCGESNIHFLSIDHVNNDGIDGIRGRKLYYWLKKNNFPKDNFQLLCMNCNFSKKQFGYCAHALALVA